jgi:hypothetical protein
VVAGKNVMTCGFSRGFSEDHRGHALYQALPRSVTSRATRRALRAPRVALNRASPVRTLPAPCHRGASEWPRTSLVIVPPSFPLPVGTSLLIEPDVPCSRTQGIRGQGRSQALIREGIEQGRGAEIDEVPCIFPAQQRSSARRVCSRLCPPAGRQRTSL